MTKTGAKQKTGKQRKGTAKERSPLGPNSKKALRDLAAQIEDYVQYPATVYVYSNESADNDKYMRDCEEAVRAYRDLLAIGAHWCKMLGDTETASMHAKQSTTEPEKKCFMWGRIVMPTALRKLADCSASRLPIRPWEEIDAGIRREMSKACKGVDNLIFCEDCYDWISDESIGEEYDFGTGPENCVLLAQSRGAPKDVVALLETMQLKDPSDRLRVERFTLPIFRDIIGEVPEQNAATEDTIEAAQAGDGMIRSIAPNMTMITLTTATGEETFMDLRSSRAKLKRAVLKHLFLQAQKHAREGNRGCYEFEWDKEAKTLRGSNVQVVGKTLRKSLFSQEGVKDVFDQLMKSVPGQVKETYRFKVRIPPDWKPSE
jgi:hypothetical protein